MTRVVPPQRAAFVPVSKSSAVTVLATSRSKWVWASIKPGKRSFPDTSRTFAFSSSIPFSTLMIFSSSIKTSSFSDFSPDTTVPFFSRYLILYSSSLMEVIFYVPNLSFNIALFFPLFNSSLFIHPKLF